MKWRKKYKISLHFEGIKLIETKRVIYKSDIGHLIYKDYNGGYLLGNRWFSKLKYAKEYAEKGEKIC